jgi:hypothetical protein
LGFIKRVVVDSGYGAELKGWVSPSLVNGARGEGGSLVHLVAVGSNIGGPLKGGVVLFNSLPVYVELARLWSGPAFHAEHEFDVSARSHRQLDVRLRRASDSNDWKG